MSQSSRRISDRHQPSIVDERRMNKMLLLAFKKRPRVTEDGGQVLRLQLVLLDSEPLLTLTPTPSHGLIAAAQKHRLRVVGVTPPRNGSLFLITGTPAQLQVRAHLLQALSSRSAESGSGVEA